MTTENAINVEAGRLLQFNMNYAMKEEKSTGKYAIRLGIKLQLNGINQSDTLKNWRSRRDIGALSAAMNLGGYGAEKSFPADNSILT